MELIGKTLAHVRIGEERKHDNLTMFPLLNGTGGQPDYLTLDEALAGGKARITEVSSSGSVPELKLVNEGDRPVLLLDGEELVGAKQNRTLNLTILAPASQTLSIPVSCVEQGRWSHRSAEFAAASHAHYAAGRAQKMAHVTDALRTTGSRHADQCEVWQDISAKAARMQADSPTGAMSAMYERHGGSLEDYVQALPAVEGQVGALFAINGEVIGLDLFDCPATLEKLLPKLVRSYGLDALDAREEGLPAASPAAAEELLKAAGAAGTETFAAIGLGEDVRFTGDGLTGGALILNERVVHLSVFRMAGTERSTRAAVQACMSRPSQRGRR
jgi:ARG/rhodanese/phosphatase superfamily protein